MQDVKMTNYTKGHENADAEIARSEIAGPPENARSTSF